nr:putative retrotransposon Gag domain-containing protein [Tanacetum cinerariifolium]
IVMANLNPKNLNVPNEGIPEEDPYHFLEYDEEEDPEMDIEEEEPEEEPVEEPKPLAGHGDQFDVHPNLQPRNMNGWVDDDDDVGDEDEENEDADIEEDDDVEFIFPYEANDEPEAEEADDELEVEEAGVEPEAEGDDVELEAEEPDGVLEATIRTGSQRRDLEALRRHERIKEVELETSRTEIALLGSEPKIGKMEREILHHDLSGVEETLGKAMERLKVIESKENLTLKKKLAEKEAMGIEAANNTPWSDVRKWMTKEFCPRSVIQRMEQELYNLRMKGMDIDGPHGLSARRTDDSRQG